MRDAIARRWSGATILWGIYVLLGIPVPAQATDLEELAKRVGIRILAEPTSDSFAMESSRKQIPYRRMSQGAQRRAADLIEQASQYRRMPCLQYEVDRHIYQYLINHPDVAIATWRAMGISKLQMNQTDAFSYEADAADGSEGIADVLWRDGNQCLFLVQGIYKSPILPNPIRASALVWLRYRFVESHDGKTLVNQQVETFVHFPSAAIDTIARLASRVTNAILDRNVFEVSLYARMMSRAADTEPGWLEQLAYRMDGVPNQRRLEMLEIARSHMQQDDQQQPAVATAADPARLDRPGAFADFESSMKHVNVHAPLAMNEVQHKPSYGTKIGAGNRYMAEPHRYTPPEAVAAMREQQRRNERTKAYNELYATTESSRVAQEDSTPNEVPPASSDVIEIRRIPNADLSANLSSSVSTRVSSANSNTTSARKAESGAATARVSPNASAKTGRANRSGPPLRNVSAPKPVPPAYDSEPAAAEKTPETSESKLAAPERKPQPERTDSSQFEQVPLLSPDEL